MTSTNKKGTTTKTFNAADELLSRMTKALSTPESHRWSVSVHLPSSISGLPQDKHVSFDVPYVWHNTKTNTLLATFHSLVGGRQTIADLYVEGRFFAIYIAECKNYKHGIVPSGDDWTVLAKLTDMGSMGSFQVQDDGSVFLAYELGSIVGSTIAIRKYSSLDRLMDNTYWEREVHLKQVVHSDRVVCVGTPSITSIGDNYTDSSKGDTDIQIRFHYYNVLDGLDHPGKGTLKFPKHGNGVVSNSYHWNGDADKDVVKALRGVGVVGKIGGRAQLFVTTTTTPSSPSSSSSSKQKYIHTNHYEPIKNQQQKQQYLLYEGQMASDGEGKTGWLSWRPVLYDLQTKKASVLTFKLSSHLKTFANPQISIINNNKNNNKENDSQLLLISFFVPNGPFSETKEVANYCSFDPDKCPTCAKDAMENAVSPASPGSVMMLIPSFDVNIDNDDGDGDDCCSDTTTDEDDEDDDEDEIRNGNWNDGNIKHRNRCIQILYCLKRWMFRFF